jgi:hypothetical protein
MDIFSQEAHAAQARRYREQQQRQQALSRQQDDMFRRAESQRQAQQQAQRQREATSWSSTASGSNSGRTSARTAYTARPSDPVQSITGLAAFALALWAAYSVFIGTFTVVGGVAISAIGYFILKSKVVGKVVGGVLTLIGWTLKAALWAGLALLFYYFFIV